MKTPIKLLALAAFSLSTLAADLTGTWQAEFDTQIGVQKYRFDFRVNGGKVTAKATAETGDQKRDVKFTEAKLEGETLSFVETRQIQDREIRIEFTGKVNDTGIKFTRKVGDFGSQESEATRIAAAAGGPAASNAQAGNGRRGGRRRGGFGGPIELGPDDKAAFSKKEKNVPHVWHVDEHAHDFEHWKKGLYNFSQPIFKPTSKP